MLLSDAVVSEKICNMVCQQTHSIKALYLCIWNSAFVIYTICSLIPYPALRRLQLLLTFSNSDHLLRYPFKWTICLSSWDSKIGFDPSSLSICLKASNFSDKNAHLEMNQVSKFNRTYFHCSQTVYPINSTGYWSHDNDQHCHLQFNKTCWSGTDTHP